MLSVFLLDETGNPDKGRTPRYPLSLSQMGIPKTIGIPSARTIHPNTLSSKRVAWIYSTLRPSASLSLPRASPRHKPHHLVPDSTVQHPNNLSSFSIPISVDSLIETTLFLLPIVARSTWTNRNESFRLPRQLKAKGKKQYIYLKMEGLVS
jgi:hypothetical protein